MLKKGLQRQAASTPRGGPVAQGQHHLQLHLAQDLWGVLPPAGHSWNHTCTWPGKQAHLLIARLAEPEEAGTTPSTGFGQKEHKSSSLSPNLPNCQPMFTSSPQPRSSPIISNDNNNKIQVFFHYLLFSHSVLSDSLPPHGVQLARLLCPSLSQTHVH